MCIQRSFSQNSYPVTFSSPLYEKVYSVIETNNNAILGVGYRCAAESSLDSYQGMVWKISANLDTISRSYNFSDTSCRFNYIEQLADESFLVIGLTYTPPEYFKKNIIVAILDSNLNIVDRKLYDLGNVIAYIEHVQELDGFYYILGQTHDSLYHVENYILQLDADFNTVILKTYAGYSGTFYDCIKMGSELWCFTKFMQPKACSEVTVFDSTLNIIDIRELPYFYDYVGNNCHLCYEGFMSVEWISDTNFLVMANHYQSFNMSEITIDNIGFSILDTSLCTQPVMYIGETDTMEYCSINDAFVLDNDNNIFFASVKNYVLGFYPNQPSWIRIGKLDSDLNQIYDITIGGDAFYRAIDIKLSNQGGTILAATKYEYTLMDYQWDVLFFKFDANGLITSSPHISHSINNSISLYPNPSEDYVNIEVEEPGHVEIFNSLGIRIMILAVNSGKQRLDLRPLMPGLYLIKYTSHDKLIIQTGKIVKT